MSSISNIKQLLAPAFRRLLPGVYWNRKLDYYRSHFSEVEMKLIPAFCKKDQTSIDIGSASGVFIANLVLHSKDVIGFEPLPDECKILEEMIRSTGIHARMENVALSDKSGETVLRIIPHDSGRSTIENSNELDDNAGNTIEIKVKVKKLDDYQFRNIGFIKIDVEGHELSVLHGARETIRNNKPILLVEIEERHKKNAVPDSCKFLEELGYHSYFVINGTIRPMSEFRQDEYQDPKNIGNHLDGYARKGIYINNFIFVHSSEKDAFFARAGAIRL